MPFSHGTPGFPHRRHRRSVSSESELQSQTNNSKTNNSNKKSLGVRFRTRSSLDGDDGGAQIPDIPFTRATPYSATPRSFETVIRAGGRGHDEDDDVDADADEDDDMDMDMDVEGYSQGPHEAVPETDYATKTAHQQQQQHHHHQERTTPRRAMTPESLDRAEAGTRSPSTAPARSLLSRSTPPAQSSVSSWSPMPSTSLAPLQTKGAPDNDGLEPLAEEEIDPASFDLVVPAHGDAPPQYSLETRSELLFGVDHLRAVFADPTLLQRFTTYLYHKRPDSVPLLVHYLDALKALRAIDYANSLCDGLVPVPGQDFTSSATTTTTTGGGLARTVNAALQERADRAFEALAQEELAAYITFTWIRTVSVTIKRRIADTLPVHLRDLSEGLAEVFCLTDPSRPDNPIVFASEEFHRTTQYGMNYVLGRNCRFLQGPKTNPLSAKRIRDRLAAGKEHCETFLNYRRDGSPFMNLLMVAPLYDSRGVVRYHIGAQVDVSGLVKDCTGLESFANLVAEREVQDDLQVPGGHSSSQQQGRGQVPPPPPKDGASAVATKSTSQKQHQQQQASGTEGGSGGSFRRLAEMFNLAELKTVREHGGELHRTQQEELGDTEAGSNWHKPRLLIRDDASTYRRNSDPNPGTAMAALSGGGRLTGPYEHYLLVRPHPNLRILFASPSLRTPGMLQSSFMSRIGGSSHVRDALAQAFADGHGVTAKIRWITPSKSSSAAAAGGEGADEGGEQGGNNTNSSSKQQQQQDRANMGKGRWIHATPLLGGNGSVGVYMVVLVDDEEEALLRRARDAPPVDAHIGGAGASMVTGTGGGGGYNNNNNRSRARASSRPWDGTNGPQHQRNDSGGQMGAIHVHPARGAGSSGNQVEAQDDGESFTLDRSSLRGGGGGGGGGGGSSSTRLRHKRSIVAGPPGGNGNDSDADVMSLSSFSAAHRNLEDHRPTQPELRRPPVASSPAPQQQQQQQHQRRQQQQQQYQYQYPQQRPQSRTATTQRQQYAPYNNNSSNPRYADDFADDGAPPIPPAPVPVHRNAPPPRNDSSFGFGGGGDGGLPDADRLTPPPPTHSRGPPSAGFRVSGRVQVTD